MRIIRWIVAGALIVAIAGASGLAAFAFIPQLNGARQSFASYILSRTFGRDVEVNGPVTLSLGREIEVGISDIVVVSIFSRSADEPERIDRGRFSVPLSGLLRGHPKLTRLDLSGVSIDVLAPAMDTASREQKLVGLAGFPSRYFMHPLSGNLTLNDVSLHFVDPEAGLDELVSIKTLRSQFSPAAKTIEIKAEGELNGLAIGLSATFDNPQLNDNKDVSFSVDFEMPGSTNKFVGTADFSAPISVIDARLDTRIDSLGDVEDSFRLQRVLEGTGSLSTTLAGPLDALKATAIEAVAEGEGGNRFSVSGTIADLVQGSGLELDFTGSLGPEDEVVAIDAPISDHRVTGFAGRLEGDFEAIQVEELVVTTNTFNVQLRDIGPISIGRIAKDANGRIVIRDIRVLDGPENRRNLDLAGEIDDALTMSGVRLAGTFDLDTAAALSLEGGDGGESLGRLTGEIALSDEDGVFGIETLTGSIRDAELMSMDLELVADDLEDLDEISLMVDLKIPDFVAFAAALGSESEARGGLEFLGNISVIDEVPKIDGSLTVGETTITGNLSAQREKGIPRLSGEIQSDALVLADLRKLWEVNLFGRNQDIDYIQFNEDAYDDFEFDVEVDAKEIEEAGKAIGDIKGRIFYSKGNLELDPFAVSFLGGTIEAANRIEISKSPPVLTTTGSVKKLPIGKLLAQLGAPNIASGTLNAKFQLAGIAKQGAFAKSATGNVTISLWGGSIGTNLIDLTGMDYVSWAFSKKQEESTEIVCAVLPLSLKGGSGNTSALVLETDNVLLAGKGKIDLKNDAIALEFQPIPKNKKTVSVATPFSITGSLRKPAINVDKQAAGQRVATEMFNMPMNIFSNLFGNNQQGESEWKGKPCVIPKADKKGEAN